MVNYSVLVCMLKWNYVFCGVFCVTKWIPFHWKMMILGICLLHSLQMFQMDEGENLFLGVETSDFTSPCKSVLTTKQEDSIYSDISDFEEADNNLAQKQETEM